MFCDKNDAEVGCLMYQCRQPGTKLVSGSSQVSCSFSFSFLFIKVCMVGQGAEGRRKRGRRFLAGPVHTMQSSGCVWGASRSACSRNTGRQLPLRDEGVVTSLTQKQSLSHQRRGELGGESVTQPHSGPWLRTRTLGKATESRELSVAARQPK